jgi:CSLREA domain-containing protein
MGKLITKLSEYTRQGVWFWVLFVLGGVGLWALPALGANYVVNSTNDVNDGTCDATHCSLREAINAANATSADDTITFSVSGTITLSSTLPAIVSTSTAGKLTIDGTGQSITISGNNSVRVFEVNSGGDLTLQNLTVSNGSAVFGGSILNGGTLTITNSTLSGNSASNIGGGIYNGGTVNITNSTFSGNSASSGE